MLPSNGVNKISIIGPVGSGKSFLAKSLGEKLNLPVFHLDDVWNLPNGERVSEKVMLKKIDEITSREKWIVDGNYRQSLARRFEVSDVIIWLNFPFEFCMQSAITRDAKNGFDDVNASFNVEENLKTKMLIKSLVDLHKEKVVELTSREQVNAFLIDGL